MTLRLRVVGVVLLGMLVLAACGMNGASRSSAAGTGSGRPAHAVAIPTGDWSQFDDGTQRSGSGPASTGITPSNLSLLRLRTVKLDGTVDSSAIELHAIVIDGRARDVLIVETTYGKVIAIDAGTGAKLWEYTPQDYGSYAGSAQLTTATPTADPDRAFVYTTSPDGLIHKLAIATGREVRSGDWPAKVTLLPTHEKLASPPSIDGSSLIVVTDGYNGDIPPYQGHIVKLDRATGRIEAVFNSLCANEHKLIEPSSCPQSDSAIWGRAGAVIEPDGDILVATSNGVSSSSDPFDGRLYWSDSVLELSPSLQLLHNWTPSNELQLTRQDADLGSTSPALLPGDLAVQGGKSGVLALLNLKALDGTTGPAGAKLGGELQDINAPGPTDVFSQPAVWTNRGTTYVFVANAAGTAAYVLSGRRLHVAWTDYSTPGTSPVVAGGLLYVYNEINGGIVVRRPTSEKPLATLAAGTGHWNSPIAVGGRVIEPEGNANQHSLSGVLDIYHLPGR